MSNFRGTGTVLDNGQEIATVLYDLRKTVDRIDTGLGETVDGLSSTQGTVKVTSQQIDLGKMYILRMANGNKVEYYASYTNNIGYPHATYQAQVNGDPEA